MNTQEAIPPHDGDECRASIGAIRDALYVLNGKWKLPIIAALAAGPKRFNELQRVLDDITPRVLTNELRGLELNGLIKRNAFTGNTLAVTYERTLYSESLGDLLMNLRAWGENHKQYILSSSRADRA